MFVCGVRPCVILVRGSVKGHDPVKLPVDSSHIYCQERFLCDVCVWVVMCGGHSEAVQGVHGLRVTGVVLVLVYEGRPEPKQRFGFETV